MLFNLSIFCGPIWLSAGSKTPFFWAVLNIPTPIGLVRYNLEPGFAPPFFFTLSGCTKPVTAKPKIGSGQSIECPPAKGIPAFAQIALAPSKTLPANSAGNKFTGQPKIAIAIIGFPPIA